MNKLRLGTIKQASAPLKVREDGSTTDMIAKFLVGYPATVAIGDRVLWTNIDGLIVVFKMTAV